MSEPSGALGRQQSLPSATDAVPTTPAAGSPLEASWEYLQALGLDRSTRRWTVPVPADWHRLKPCKRTDCPNFTLTKLCPTCSGRWRAAGKPDVEVWLREQAARGTARLVFGESLCRICRTPEHERPAESIGMCSRHWQQYRRKRKRGEFSTADEFVSGGHAAPLPSLGRCEALVNGDEACVRLISSNGLCGPHGGQFHKSKQTRAEWVQAPHPLKRPTPMEVIDLSVLSDVQYSHVCWAMEQDIHGHHSIYPRDVTTAVRWLAGHTDGESLADLDPGRMPRKQQSPLRRWFDAVVRVSADPQQEPWRDPVRLAVLNPDFRGATVDLSEVTQPWLRELAGYEIRRRTAEGVGKGTITTEMRGLRWWSAYLRTQPDGGTRPELLTKSQATGGFKKWLNRRKADSLLWAALATSEDPADRARWEHTGTRLLRANGGGRNPAKQRLLITTSTMREPLTAVNTFLQGQRDRLVALGKNPSTWGIDPRDIPTLRHTRKQAMQERGETQDDKPLPRVVFRQLEAGLDGLGEDGPYRNAVELAMHMGRRPEDQISLPFDCLLEREIVVNGEVRCYSWLRYTDRLKDGSGGHLVVVPLLSKALAVIRRQQSWIRADHPEWFDETGRPLDLGLRLFPRPARNRNGLESLEASNINNWLSLWIGKTEAKGPITPIDSILGADGQPFSLERITAYALRHTFGQNLRDAGVPIDVIQQLMGHDEISSTQVYARPNHLSQITGIEELESFRYASIDSEGSVVMLPSPTLRTDDHEAITRAAMECGGCAEKGNVEAHGHACRYGMHCLDCVFFRGQVTDLPDLRRTRTRSAAAVAQFEARTGDTTDFTSSIIQFERRKVERCDQFIDALEDEIDQSDLTANDQARIRAVLTEWQAIDTELLQPLAAASHPVGLVPDRDSFDPRVAAEAEAIINLRNETPIRQKGSVSPGSERS